MPWIGSSPDCGAVPWNSAKSFKLNKMQQNAESLSRRQIDSQIDRLMIGCQDNILSEEQLQKTLDSVLTAVP